MANLTQKFRGATNMGRPNAPAGYISEIYTSGLEVGTPFAYGTDGTLIKADQALALPAVGVIVKADPVGVDEAYEDNKIAKAMPKSKMGSIHDEEKLAVFTIVENSLRFRTKDETIVSTATGTSATKTVTVAGVDLTSTLKVGDFIEISQATKTTTKTQVSAISFATNTTITTKDNLADTYTAGVVVGKTMKGKPVYLGDNSGSTKFSKLGIPYTTLAPATGEWGQEVGYVYSACEIFIDLTNDKLGKTI